MTWEEYHEIQDNWIPKVGDLVRLKDFIHGPFSWSEGLTGLIIKVEDCFNSIWKSHPNIKGLTIKLDDEWTSGKIYINGEIPIKVGKLDSIHCRLHTDEIRKFLKMPKDKYEK